MSNIWDKIVTDKWLSDEWVADFIALFKEQFARDFQFLPNLLPEGEDAQQYISDSDLTRALYEALAIFPSDIFEDARIRTLALLYLTAHYLCEDFRNAQQGLNSVGTYPATSKTVRNVSEAYALPTWVTQNPVLSYISETGYGKKYLSLYWPRTIGRMRVVGGWTLA